MAPTAHGSLNQPPGLLVIRTSLHHPLIFLFLPLCRTGGYPITYEDLPVPPTLGIPYPQGQVYGKGGDMERKGQREGKVCVCSFFYLGGPPKGGPLLGFLLIDGSGNYSAL